MWPQQASGSIPNKPPTTRSSLDDDGPTSSGLRGKLLASAGVVGGLVVLAGGSLLLRNQIRLAMSHPALPCHVEELIWANACAQCCLYFLCFTPTFAAASSTTSSSLLKPGASSDMERTSWSMRALRSWRYPPSRWYGGRETGRKEEAANRTAYTPAPPAAHPIPCRP